MNKNKKKLDEEEEFSHYAQQSSGNFDLKVTNQQPNKPPHMSFNYLHSVERLMSDLLTSSSKLLWTFSPALVHQSQASWDF